MHHIAFALAETFHTSLHGTTCKVIISPWLHNPESLPFIVCSSNLVTFFQVHHAYKLITPAWWRTYAGKGNVCAIDCLLTCQVSQVYKLLFLPHSSSSSCAAISTTPPLPSNIPAGSSKVDTCPIGTLSCCSDDYLMSFIVPSLHQTIKTRCPTFKQQEADYHGWSTRRL
jgi:hypothetical protein